MDITAAGTYKIGWRSGRRGVFQWGGTLAGAGTISFAYSKDGVTYKNFALADGLVAADAADEGIEFVTACANLAVIVTGAGTHNLWTLVTQIDEDD